MLHESWSSSCCIFQACRSVSYCDKAALSGQLIPWLTDGCHFRWMICDSLFWETTSSWQCPDLWPLTWLLFHHWFTRAILHRCRTKSKTREILSGHRFIVLSLNYTLKEVKRQTWSSWDWDGLCWCPVIFPWTSVGLGNRRLDMKGTRGQTGRQAGGQTGGQKDKWKGEITNSLYSINLLKMILRCVVDQWTVLVTYNYRKSNFFLVMK